MPEKYSLQEIVIFAIEIEKEGIVFYNKMSKKTSSQKLKKVFQKLESEEKEHQKKFESILKLLGPDKNEYLYHSENVYVGYLHAFRMFADKVPYRMKKVGFPKPDAAPEKQGVVGTP